MNDEEVEDLIDQIGRIADAVTLDALSRECEKLDKNKEFFDKTVLTGLRVTIDRLGNKILSKEKPRS